MDILRAKSGVTMKLARQQHYRFAYSALPSLIFVAQAPSKLLTTYPDGIVTVLYQLWEMLGKQLPLQERAPVEGLKVTAHLLAGKHVVLLVHMPIPERLYETHFIAVVFTPAIRYFLLGSSARRSWDEVPQTTFRELSPDGVNASLGPGPTPSPEAFVRHLCTAFNLPEQVEALSDEEVRTLAESIPACGPSTFVVPSGRYQERKKRWWEFWKS